MISLTAKEITDIVGGVLHGDPTAIVSKAPVFNSVKAQPGSLFLALIGEKSDGHEYVQDAFLHGATLALTSKKVVGNCLVVPDVISAVSTLAIEIRNRLSQLTVIGITGSTGKTTAKDLLTAVLTVHGPTVATMQSFNNELGMPITLLECDEKTAYCILEMGARHSGDIARLCEIAKPNIGVVLGVGSAHLGEFGSVEKIASTKSELIKSLGPDGIAILGSYDSWTLDMANVHNGRTVIFGVRPTDEVRAADIELREGRPHFDLVTSAGRDAVGLRLVGSHQVANALSAAAVATVLGLSIESIASALSTAEIQSKWRMELHELPDLMLINDSYNANPESMAAALRTLVLFAQESGGQSWAFLGAMKELGSQAAQEHAAIGFLAHTLGVDNLVCVNAAGYGEAVPENSHLAMHYCPDRNSALELVSHVSPGDVILVKGSRSEGLEELARGIEEVWLKRSSEIVEETQ